MESLIQDLRYALRVLIKKPGFTAVAVITLALGIGANSAIFSVVNAVLLRSLPYEDGDRLVWIWGTQPQLDKAPVAPANFLDIKEQNEVFDNVAAFRGQSGALTGQYEPERVRVAAVSADFFSLFKVLPLLGRVFNNQDEQSGNTQVIILSHALWQRRFGSNPGILDQKLTLNDRPYSVIGVAPAEFQYPTYADLWIPLVFDAKEKSIRDTHSLSAVGRLKPGASIEQGQANIGLIAATLEQNYPRTNTGIGMRIVPLKEQITGSIQTQLLIIFAAVGFVLLIACANVANLMLARAASRQKEMAIRTALGAASSRLARLLLTESVVLAVVGGVLGLLLAYWGTQLLVSASPTHIPRVKEIAVDLRVLGFTILLSFLTGILFGITPALQARRTDLNETLKEGGRSSSQGLGGYRMRKIFVVSQMALALVLLISAGLMIKSFLKLQQVDLGFNERNLLTMQVTLPRSKYNDGQTRAAFFQRAVDRIKALPGVEGAGAITNLPLSGANDSTSFIIEGREPSPDGKAPLTEYRSITPDYFRAMGIGLVKGRFFDETDQPNTSKVAIINESLARRFFGDQEPIGQRIGLSGPPDWREIVGVVRDVRHYGPDNEPKPETYVPYNQNQASYLQYGSMALVIRGENPSNLVSGVRGEILAVDSSQPVYNAKSMEQVVADSVAQRRLDTLLLALLAAVALLLAAVGTYSVMAYTVAQRTHEMGVRMALGAQPRDVIKLVLGQALSLALIGVTIGLGAAFGLMRFVSGLLYGVSLADPVIYIGLALLLGAVAILASYFPARRATRVDPLSALRSE
ncbi:MAG TPA: ABC transporter permease [Blastocatellia bacterium]